MWILGSFLMRELSSMAKHLLETMSFNIILFYICVCECVCDWRKKETKTIWIWLPYCVFNKVDVYLAIQLFNWQCAKYPFSEDHFKRKSRVGWLMGNNSNCLQQTMPVLVYRVFSSDRYVIIIEILLHKCIFLHVHNSDMITYESN